MLLTIAIPTIESRAQEFKQLYSYLEEQIRRDNLAEKVEVIHECDNKQMSIGTKRDKLYRRASGLHTVQIDDDDTVAPDYCKVVCAHIEEYPEADAFGYIESVDQQGKRCLAHHDNRFIDWSQRPDGSYQRTLFFKDPIKTEICQAVGVKDMRFGEDHDFARRLKASGLILHSEFINKIMYYYRYKYEPHNQKYGIK